jgi:hypothetical protein
VRLLLVLAFVGNLAAAPAPTRFVLPKRFLMTTSPAGADIWLQARVDRHAANRWVSIAWVSAGGESGLWEKSVDGDRDGALFPIEPILVHVSPGVYELRLRVFDSAGKLRESVTENLTVCGAGDECLK